MPTTRLAEVSVFPYEELTKKAQSRAQEWYRSWRNDAWDFSDQGYLTENMVERLKEKGYPTEKICWSLSRCQGDGVAFYGEFLGENLEIIVRRLMPDRCKLASLLSKDAEFPNNFLDYLENITFEIVNCNAHYHHWNTMRINHKLWDTSEEDNIKFALVFDDFVGQLKADIIETSKELERMGYNEIDYLYSEECLIDEAKSNGWLFDIEGNFIE